MDVLISNMWCQTYTASGEDGWHSTTDSTGAYLIDRSPEYFELLLNFLRHGKLLFNHGVNAEGLICQAYIIYYHI